LVENEQIVEEEQGQSTAPGAPPTTETWRSSSSPRSGTLRSRTRDGDPRSQTNTIRSTKLVFESSYPFLYLLSGFALFSFSSEAPTPGPATSRAGSRYYRCLWSATTNN
jgi:hypothetical protein